MKINIVLMFLLLAVPASLWAVTAQGELMAKQQPDGTWIQLRLVGDEFYHRYEDAHGFTVLPGADGFWHYADSDGNGELVITDAVVGKASPFRMGLTTRLHSKKALAQAREKRTHRDVQNRSTPTIGTIANLVVMVEFSDLAHQLSDTLFEPLMNQIGYSADGAYGSVKDFYLEASYNQLTINSTVTVWVTLNNGYAYYGGNDVDGYDLRPREMVSEALAKLEASGFNFAPLDTNADGYVDALTVIHAGYGEETGAGADYIWSHQWSLQSEVVYDGVRLRNYHTEPELRGSTGAGITRIGVICHETGHFLGLPDLYDTDGSSEGIGNWCLMAAGNWGWNPSYDARPIHPSAWCKLQLNWLTARNPGNGQITSTPIVGNKDIVKISSSFPANQYLLVENKQQIGFETNIPAAGLCIWRVDDAKATPDNSDNNQEWPGPGNDVTQHYRVALIQADGLWEIEKGINRGNAGDIFLSGNLPKDVAQNPNTGCYVTGTNVTATSVEILNIHAAGSPKRAPAVVQDMIWNLGGLTAGLAISDAVVSEQAGIATFTVTLLPGDPAQVTVYYQTADGTALAGLDYVAIPPTLLTFAIGETSKTFTVTILNDIASESDEKFYVNLSNATNANILDSQGECLIQDDDNLPPQPQRRSGGKGGACGATGIELLLALVLCFTAKRWFKKS